MGVNTTADLKPMQYAKAAYVRAWYDNEQLEKDRPNLEDFGLFYKSYKTAQWVLRPIIATFLEDWVRRKISMNSNEDDKKKNSEFELSG